MLLGVFLCALRVCTAVLERPRRTAQYGMGVSIHPASASRSAPEALTLPRPWKHTGLTKETARMRGRQGRSSLQCRG